MDKGKESFTHSHEHAIIYLKGPNLENKRYWRFYFIILQIIVLCSWAFSAVFNLPKFLTRTFDEQKNHCIQSWPKTWMITTYCLAWLLLVIASAVTMIALYSKVVYTLWFKSNENNPLNHKQQVGSNCSFLMVIFFIHRAYP